MQGSRYLRTLEDVLSLQMRKLMQEEGAGAWGDAVKVGFGVIAWF